MTYKVFKTDAPAFVDGERCDFDVTRYYVTWNGRAPKENDIETPPYIEMWADGSLTLNSREKRLFLYDDEWRGVIEAITAAQDDKKKKMELEHQKWVDETIDATEFYGVKVDLSRRQVMNALATCEITVEQSRYREIPFIKYNGEIYGLCRTDLFDDVATGFYASYTADEWRAHFSKKAERGYGGRLSTHMDGRKSFCIIDSTSDG